MTTDGFAAMLAGGHPNSLGRTEEVVALVLADETRLAELFACYGSDDAVVRLRTSSAMKRVEAARPDLVTPWLDRLISEIGVLDQASAQWTLAILFDRQKTRMTTSQKADARALMMRNLAEDTDWIVINTTIDVLARWAADDGDLRDWLRPQLHRHASDPRKSVSKRAAKALIALG